MKEKKVRKKRRRIDIILVNTVWYDRVRASHAS